MSRYQFGPFEIDAVAGTLLQHGTPVEVQPAMFTLLQYFLERPAELLTRERLLAEVWDVHVGDDALSQLLSRLRRTLGDNPRSPAFIQTVPRRGYRWVAAVTVATEVRAAPQTLVGRAQALATLAQAGPIAWVTGTGGVGKTALVEAHVAGLTPPAGGVWWCGLAEVEDALGVAVTLASALGLSPDKLPIAQVGRALAGRGPTLVVLDDAERAVERVPEVLAVWREAAPACRFIVASRERVTRTVGDPTPVVVLEPLDLPETDDATAVGLSDASTLFVRRARDAVPAFEVDEANAADVARILWAVDGLPLAIELAAARLRLLGVKAIRERLFDEVHLDSPPGRTLDLLADRRRAGPSRHAALRATIQWSWELLTPAERQVIDQLAVFRGPFAAGDAEAVVRLGTATSPPRDLLDALDGLLEKSLLQVRSRDPSVRMRMLDPIRAFAAEQLAARGDPGPALRHAEWFARFGDAEALSTLDRDEGGLTALAAARSDLAAALQTAITKAHPELAVSLLTALVQLIRLRGPVIARAGVPAQDGATLAEAVLQMPRLQGLARARALRIAGGCLAEVGEPARAEAVLREAISLASAEAPTYLPEAQGALARHLLLQTQLRDAAALAEAALASDPDGPWQAERGDWLSVKGLAHLREGDYDEARGWFERAHDFERLRDNHRRIGIALANMAGVGQCTGAFVESQRMLEQSIAIQHALGNHYNETASRVHLADALQGAGELEKANAILVDTIPRLRALGGLHWLSVALFLQGTILVRLDDMDQASAVLEEAVACAERYGSTWLQAAAAGRLGEILVKRGFERAGFTVLDEAEAKMRELGERTFLCTLLVARARAELAGSAPERALQRVQDAESLARDLGNLGILPEIAALGAQCERLKQSL